MCACMRVCERTTFHLMFLYVVCVSVCCKVYACIVYTGWICISARMLCHVRAHFQKVIVDCRVQTPIGDEIDLLCLFTWRFIFNQSLSLHQLLFFLPALWRSHIQRNNERLWRDYHSGKSTFPPGKVLTFIMSPVNINSNSWVWKCSQQEMCAYNSINQQCA